MHLADLAAAIGLGGGTSKNSPIVRTIDRLGQFGHTRRPDPNTVALHLWWRDLAARQHARLPAIILDLHDQRVNA